MKFYRYFSLKEVANLIPTLIPIAIVFLGVISTIILVYGHLKISPLNQRVPAASYQKSLIEFHLKLAGPRSTENNQTVTVSLSEGDLQKLQIVSSPARQDTRIENYVEVLKAIAKDEPYQVILYWNPIMTLSPHEIALIETLLIENPKKFTIYTTQQHLKITMSQFGNFANVKVSEFCAGESFSICPYDKSWTFWNIVDLLVQFGQEIPSEALSSNLSLDFNAFLLNLDSGNQVDDYSFIDILNSDQNNADEQDNSEINFRDKIVFVGNSLPQGVKGTTGPLATGRVKTPHIDPTSEVRFDGVPIHKFLAAVSRMYMEEAYISIASTTSVTVLNFILGVTSFFSSLLLGPFIGLLILIAYLIGSNLIEIGLISQFNYYFPLFDGLFLASIMYILGGFFRLLVENIRVRLNVLKEKNSSENADLKSNFISLISHNLNTPVAKMISLLELSRSNVDPALFKDKISPSLKDASEIQISVRNVLATNRLEDQRINQEIITSEKLIEELTYETVPLLKRMDIELNIENESPDPQARFYMDRRIIVPVVSAASYLLTDIEKKDKTSLFLTLTHNDEASEVSLEWNTLSLSPKILENYKPQNFVDETCKTFVDSFLKNYSASLAVEEDPSAEGFNVKLKITCE